MRITQMGMMRSYNSLVNRQSNQMNAAFNRATTGRKFFKGSEDVSNAAATRRLYQSYSKNKSYLSNISLVENQVQEAQSAVLSISKQIDSAYGYALNAVSDTSAPEDRAIAARQLREIQEQMVQTLNTQYNGKYLFNGSETGEAPFAINGGTITFRGLDISDPANYNDLKDMLGETQYIDIGYGMKFENGEVVSGTAFDTAVNAMAFLGIGEDADGMPNNILVLLGEIADALESDSYNRDYAAGLVDKLHGEHQGNFVVELTGLDSKASLLNVTQTRLEAQQEHIDERLADVAYVDSAEAIKTYEALYYSYTMSLKMGASLLSVSFLDFLN